MSLWHDRWSEGRIGFHRDGVNPHLERYAGWLLQEASARVLVPLCGKSHDLPWLAERGHHALGVELVERAATEFHREQGREARIERGERVVAYRSPGIDFLVGDVFDVEPADVGELDAVWDRAALVALPPERRGAYVRHLRALAGPGARVLLNCFEYDSSLMSGPPFSVPEAEVREHYAGARIEVLESRDAIDEVRWKDRGHEYWHSTTYGIELS